MYFKLRTAISLAKSVLAIALLQSCQIVQADVDDKYQFKHRWNYLGKLGSPQLIKLTRSYLVEDWTGDARRFRAIELGTKSQSLILVELAFHCSEGNCPINGYTQPGCNWSNRCTRILFMEQNNQYQEVLYTDFWNLAINKNMVRISSSYIKGVPHCIEMVGYDNESQLQGIVPAYEEDQRVISRYCLEEQQYQLDRIYLVADESLGEYGDF